MVTTEMGIWANMPIIVLQDKSLTPNAIRVYLALASFQGNSKSCFPSLEAIAERSGLKRDAIPAATDCLVKAGWIQKIRHGQGRPNTYRLLQKSEPLKAEVEDCTILEVEESIHSSSRDGSACKRTYKKNIEKEHINTTGEVESTSTSLAPLAPSKDDTLKCLKDSIRQSFLAVQPFGNYPRENAQVKRLADTVLRFFPDDPLTGARAMLESYYRLTKGRDKFWSSQPFTPSALVSLWDRVWTERTKTSGAADVSWLER